MANQNNFISASVQLGKQMDMLSQEMKEPRSVTHDVQFPPIDESLMNEYREQHINDPLSENRRYGQFSEVTDQMRDRNVGSQSFRDRKIKYRRKDKKSDLDSAQDQPVRNSSSSVSDNPAVEIAPILMDGIDPLIKSNEEVNESLSKNAEKLDKMTEALAMLAARLGHDNHSDAIMPFIGDHDGLFHYDPPPENKYKSEIGDDKSLKGAIRRGVLDSNKQLNAPKTLKERFGRFAGRLVRGYAKNNIGDYIASEHGHKVQQETYLSPLLDKERSARTDMADQLKLRGTEEEEKSKITQKIHESRALGKNLKIDGVHSGKLKHYADPNEQAGHIMRMKVAQKNLEAHVAFDPNNADKTAELQRVLEEMRGMVYGGEPTTKATTPVPKSSTIGKKAKKHHKFDSAPEEPANIMPEMSREDKMRNLLQNDPIGLLSGKYEDVTSMSNRDKLAKIKEENRRNKGRFGKPSNISYVRDTGAKAEHRSRLGGNGKSRNADTMKVNKMVVGKLVTTSKGESGKKNKEDAPQSAKPDEQQLAQEQPQEKNGGNLDTIMDFMGGRGGAVEKAGKVGRLGRLASLAAPMLPALLLGSAGYAAASQAESADMTNTEDFNIFSSVARGAKSFADSANSFFGFGNSAKTKQIQSQIENGATFSQEEADKIKADYGFEVPATAIQSVAVKTPVITATDVAPVQTNQANEFDAINNTNTTLKQETAQVQSAPIIVNNNNQSVSHGGGGGHVGITTATRPSENSFQRFTNRTFVPY